MSYADAWLKWFPVIEPGAQTLARRMIQLADLDAARRVLDIGTGIGEPALSAFTESAFSGQMLALDVDAQMIEIGRKRAREKNISSIEFICSEIETIPLPAQSFDAILARWSMMFVNDFATVLEKLALSLVPGGRLVMASWASPDQVPALTLHKTTVHRYFGWEAPDFGPGTAFSLCDPALVESALRDAGLIETHSEKLEVRYRYPSAAEYIQCRLDLTGPFWEGMESASETERRAVFSAIETALQPHRLKTGEYELVNHAYCFSGRAAR